jgi:photosystem II stability/assembly factor-like uncharacterized protein
MWEAWLSRLGILVLLTQLLVPAARAVSWFPLGPYGGDARSFAADPHDSKHLYLGTETGWVYQSHDGGQNWERLAQVQGQSDLVIDHILIDPSNPQRLIVGAWTVNRPDGGIYVSEDGGKHWYDQAEMHGQSVRSLAMATTDPKLLIAGTLRGVYRSEDGGTHWKQISPEGSTEIHEVESVAIDPKDPKIIYIGTWHLPWKTMDGGVTWQNIKQGIIDDSDVFSIIIDPTRPNIVYASACSGIYKSVNAGEQFKGGVSLNKTQGIPSTARRTRKLVQDPTHPDTVYAGTTEGLYKTTDGATTWTRETPDDVIVNDVYVDPNDPQRILLATDRGGVLRSENGATTFEASNTGFSSRQVAAYTEDPHDPAAVYVGVVNDKRTGGVFASHDGGVQWQQMSLGLDGRDVFSLVSSPNDTLLAGTSHGIFKLQGALWVPAMSAPAPTAPKRKEPVKPTTAHKGTTAVAHARPVAKPAPPNPALVDASFYSLISDGPFVYAGTSTGLWRSSDDGQNWTAMHAPDFDAVRLVASHGSVIVVAGTNRVAISTDAGVNWAPAIAPAALTQIRAVAIDGQDNLWIGGPEGVFYSKDHGTHWDTLRNLFVREVDGIYYDRRGKRVLVTASDSTVAFAADLPDYKVSYWDTGWKLRFLRPVGDHLIGATLYDGMVIEPKMVVSPVAAEATANAR